MKIFLSLLILLVFFTGAFTWADDSFAISTEGLSQEGVSATQDLSLDTLLQGSLLGGDSKKDSIMSGGSTTFMGGSSLSSLDFNSEGDFYSSPSVNSQRSKKEFLELFDSSLLNSSRDMSTTESLKTLWTSTQFSMGNYFTVDSSSDSNLNLFSEHKAEPLRINALWNEDTNLQKSDVSSEPPLGWSLGPNTAKKPAKKGWLDW